MKGILPVSRFLSAVRKRKEFKMLSCSLHNLYDDWTIIKTCFRMVLLFYGLVTVMAGTSYWGLLVIVVLTWFAYYSVSQYSLPPGDEILTREILGSDVFEEKPLVTGDKNENSENDFRLRVVAHRFAGLDAPENSLSALENCHKAGCYAVEFDITVTSDNVIVLFHDDTLERLAGLPGRVSSMSWNQLSSVNIAANHPFRDQFQTANIPKFEDVVKKCLEYDMRMFIDIKDSKSVVVDGVCKMFEKYPMMYRRAVVSSFNPMIIYQIRKRRPSVVGCLAWRPYYNTCHNYVADNPESQERRFSSPILYYIFRIVDHIHTWAYFNIIPTVLGLSCVLVHKDTITKDMLLWWRKKNIRCLAWTVNQPSEKQHFFKNLRVTYLTDTMHANEPQTVSY